jgi:hypothetical protein
VLAHQVRTLATQFLGLLQADVHARRVAEIPKAMDVGDVPPRLVDPSGRRIIPTGGSFGRSGEGRTTHSRSRESRVAPVVRSVAQDAAAELTTLGGARLILATTSSATAMSALIPGLAPGGQMLVAGADAEPIQVSTTDLIFGGRAVAGTLTGSAADNEDTLAFSVLQDVRARIEVVPLVDAPVAYARMMNNQARFRMVLDMSAR